jgi:hypothetical protein
MATNTTPQEIIIEALVERIKSLHAVIPGAVGDPRQVIDKLVRRGEVEYCSSHDDPLMQRTVRLIK